MEIGFIGLGKMGMNMVTRLQRDKHRVVVYDRAMDLIKQAEGVGCISASSLDLFDPRPDIVIELGVVDRPREIEEAPFKLSPFAVV